MSDQYGLSRDLSQDELPHDAHEALEEARTVDRKPLASGKRASGTEEKAGTEERPSSDPARDTRPEFKPPPFDAPTH